MRIKIQPAFVAYSLCIAFLNSWQICVCTLLSLILHEIGHCVASYIVHDRINTVELTPFGGVIQYVPGASPRKGIKGFCVASAGPLVNYLMLLLLAFKPVQILLGRSLARSFAAANLSILALNLLPVFPLDGGRMLFCIGYYVFPIAQMVTCLSGLGICAGLSLIILSIYGFAVHSILNCSLLFVGLYLIVCAHKTGKIALVENTYAAIQEQSQPVARIHQVRVYHVPNNTSIYELVTYIIGKPAWYASVFLFENESLEECSITSQALCKLFLENPSSTIAEAFQLSIQKQEKSG